MTEPVIKAPIFVAFDVDGTLLSKADGYEDTPNYKVIESYFHYRDVLGHKMIVWSGNGKDWARTWAMKLGLKHRFEDVSTDPLIMEKPRMADPYRLIPDICVDDEDVKLGKENIRV